MLVFKKHGDVKLTNACTFHIQSKIEHNIARTRNDMELLILIQGLDLIALKAKYHKNCIRSS